MVRERGFIKGIVSCDGTEKVVVIILPRSSHPVASVFKSTSEANNFFNSMLMGPFFDDEVEKILPVTKEEFWRKLSEFRKNDERLSRLNINILMKNFAV